MGIHGMLLVIQISLIGLIISSIMVAAAASLAKFDCPNKCEDVEIPYPFGLKKGCSLNEDFLITCDNKVAKTGDVTVKNISIENHELRVLHFVARDCYEQHRSVEYNQPFVWPSTFIISQSRNKFTVVGCDTYGILHGEHNGEYYSSGCLTVCKSLHSVRNGSCSGVGCCQVAIPAGLRNISMEVDSFNNHTNVLDFNPCSSAFIVEQGQFNFSSNYLRNVSKEMLPIVLDWTIGNETCEEAARNKTNFACQRNSECHDHFSTKLGYQCSCKPGYRGNPYLGCQDINECEHPAHNNCIKAKDCVNTKGNYTCRCPKWYHGDGRKGGEGCIPEPLLMLKIAGVAVISLIAILVISFWLYFLIKKRRLVKLKEKFFRQNGGLILQQQLSTMEGSSETTKIYTAKDLKKATNNYDASRIIGQGGYGLVYKGFLENNKVVAIKKSKTVDQEQIEQFITEVVVLIQVNHRNVVQLLGCCLETRVPLLVYEFVPNSTLFKHIHHASTISWETRLRIAIEIADALSYLHSAASIPIIHRDIKSTNVLLDDDFAAKVSDFGTSRLVPRGQKQLPTVVQGTLGYLDPEYMQTNQFTEKSDVYSFGVVLVELLTGQKVLSLVRPMEQRSLAMYLLCALKEDRLFEILEKRIMDEGNMEQLKEFAKLAAKCLEVKGVERPTMKEVAIELYGLRKMKNHLWDNDESNLMEETGPLIGEC
ncbi:wall-associated receptor kinase 2 [Quercus suber]|uniref:wall-associated receptor kinase 2 n=1 Tax=Quercus suber TaxID=58331 RepID=UPI000CE277D7|nr:wall-associated receptor kinase 2-like [Quercus suber]